MNSPGFADVRHHLVGPSEADPLSAARGRLAAVRARREELREAEEAYQREVALVEAGLKDIKRQYNEMEDK